MLKKVLVWGMMSFIIFGIAFRPKFAVAVVTTLGQTLIDIGDGIGKFFGGLVS